MKIHHSQPFFGPSDRRGLGNVLSRGFVSTGPLSERFGTAAAKVLGKAWGIPLQSGTDALTAALALMGVKEGAKVAVPAYVCSAPLDSIAFFKAQPVPVDVDLETLAVCPERIGAGRGFSAVIGAHLFGIPAPLGRIRHRGLIEDCAQTLLAKDEDGRTVGKSGRLSTCSFYATKLLTTGHGGLLAGDDPELRAEAMRLFLHDKQDEWRPHMHFLMSDLNAALGISQLAKLRKFIAERRRLASRFAKALDGRTGRLRGIYSRFLVAAPDGTIDEYLAKFARKGIEAKRPVYRPLYQYLRKSGKEFPAAEWAHQHLISVPIYPGLGEDAAQKIEEFLWRNRNELRRWPPA